MRRRKYAEKTKGYIAKIEQLKSKNQGIENDTASRLLVNSDLFYLRQGRTKIRRIPMKKLALTLALLLILTCTSAIAEPDTSEDPYGAMSTEERNDLIKTLLSYNMRESIATYDTTREFKDQSRSNPIFVGQGVAFAWAIGDETFELLLYLNDVIRGEEALDLVMEANSFNSEPDAGKEYVIGIFQMYLLDAESENSKIEVGHGILKQ